MVEKKWFDSIVGNTWSCSVVMLDPLSSLMFYHHTFCHHNCIYYDFLLWIYSVHTTSFSLGDFPLALLAVPSQTMLHSFAFPLPIQPCRATPGMDYLRCGKAPNICPSWERDPSSVALPVVSSVFSLLKGLFRGCFSSLKGWRTYGVAVHIV